ncbi:amidase signature enzyme [Glonium stellatum]|uniref:Amidase signature enzyme n=1 Tax=Glonium stellatum TaxID=574774 RepID=A0A8E2F981_9PEZI|nr:amidase signature enzyme [Glonium stellatum]
MSGSVQNGNPIAPNFHITKEWLQNSVNNYVSKDDVFRKEFLAGIIFVGAGEEEVQITEDGKELLDRFGMRFSVYLNTASERLMPGPCVVLNHKALEVSRLYPDENGAFLAALRPGIYNVHEKALSIAVPSRLRYTNTSETPLAGLRVAVKDNFNLQGLRTSLCNRAYFSTYPPCNKTAKCIQRLIDVGAVIVGTTKLASFAATEEPTQCVDYQAPWNPRADGYQSPAGSSSGSGAAVGAYDWLDIGIGSDTSGSGRRPGHWNGCFAMRPTFGVIPVDGMVSSFEMFDTPTFLGRDLQQMRDFAAAWYGNELNNRIVYPISAIIWPSDFWTFINPAQESLAKAFTSELEAFLGLHRKDISFAAEWATSPPEEAGLESLDDFTKKASRDSFWYDDYHAFDKFREDCWKKYQKSPYISPPVRVQWEAARNITKAERDEAIRRLLIYRGWFLSQFTNANCGNVLVILPIENISPRYRDEPPAPFIAPTGVTTLMLGPILEGPELVVPIGEIPYQSKVSGIEEHLPVSIGLMALPGSDLMLMDLARECLKKAGRPTRVHAGRHMFKK